MHFFELDSSDFTDKLATSLLGKSALKRKRRPLQLAMVECGVAALSYGACKPCR